MRGVVIGVVLAFTLTACGAPAGPGSGTGTEIVETIDGVNYYYACGNEVLELSDGRRFYPFVDQDGVDEHDYIGATLSGSPAVLVAATLAVPAPEPGDDTGTLIVYEDGTARFMSDSGIEAWLTEQEQTYNWVC